MTTETDIANRALQRVGAASIAAGALWTEDSANAAAIRVCYDMARKSELRRNAWRFAIRTELLRARTATTNLILYSTWDARAKYEINDRVVRNGKTWICIGAGINHDPDARTYDYWTSYFGSDTAEVYSATTTYAIGEQVYSGSTAYISVADSNLGNAVTNTSYWLPLMVPAWAAFTIYEIGHRVTVSGVTYVSLQSNNQNNAPASSPTWWDTTSSQTMALASYAAPVPAGSNVVSSGVSIFRLPKGFLREAPQAPKTKGMPYSDWQYEGNYFTTQMAGPIAFRFIADIDDPNDWDAMFVDAFSSRLGLEVCEVLSQSTGKVQTLSAVYNKFMSEARVVNGIETGWVEPPEDDYITVRY